MRVNFVKSFTAVFAAVSLLAACATEPTGVYRYVDITGNNRGQSDFKMTSGECRSIRTQVFLRENERLTASAGPATYGVYINTARIMAPQIAAEIADQEMDNCYLRNGWEKRYFKD